MKKRTLSPVSIEIDTRGLSKFYGERSTPPSFGFDSFERPHAHIDWRKGVAASSLGTPRDQQVLDALLPTWRQWAQLMGEIIRDPTDVRVRCSTCNLPEDVRRWVDGKIKEGASAQSLAAFLGSKGFQVSSSAIINHKNSHVA